MKYDLIDIKTIQKAQEKLVGIVKQTELQFSDRLSTSNQSKVWLKREDLQDVRSFKIRGAFNKISSFHFLIIPHYGHNHKQHLTPHISHLKE